jgi:hypothetical protein
MLWVEPAEKSTSQDLLSGLEKLIYWLIQGVG